MINIDGQSYLDVREAAERLGVKPETLYAYVSRGMLRSYRQGIRRSRLYLLNEIEELLRLRPGAPDTSATPPAPTSDAAEGRSPIPSSLPSADPWAAER